MKHLVLFIILSVGLVACQHTPPELTPAASAAFKGTQAVRVLDLIRDTATTANEQVPPLMSTEDTRKVVLYHQSAVKTIQAAPTGWKATVDTGLNELLNNLSPPDRARLGPYAALLKTVLAEVVR